MVPEALKVVRPVRVHSPGINRVDISRRLSRLRSPKLCSPARCVSMREAQSDSARLAIADQAREKGELSIASRMYLKLASNRVPTPASTEAQKRLDTIREDTRKQLDDLLQRLADVDNVSPSEQMPPESADRVKTCISELEELADQVGRVPEVGREVKSALAKNKSKPHVLRCAGRARCQTTVGRGPGAWKARARCVALSCSMKRPHACHLLPLRSLPNDVLQS